MAIRYTGDGNLGEVNIALIGDGASTSVTIDLTKAPFDFNFTGFFPTAISVRSSGQPQEFPIQLLSNGQLQIDYPEPLAVEEATAQDKITIRLLYG